VTVVRVVVDPISISLVGNLLYSIYREGITRARGGSKDRLYVIEEKAR
jgi:hypothetical protein